MGLLIYRSTQLNKAAERTSEGASGVTRTTPLLWAIKSRTGKIINQVQKSQKEIKKYNNEK